MRRGIWGGGVLPETAGDEAGLIVAAGVGALGVRRFLRTSSSIRCASSDGFCGEGAVTVADAEADGAADGPIEGEGRSAGGDGRIRTEGDADTIGDGVAAGAVDAAAEGDGRVLTEADGETVGAVVAVACTVGVGLAAAGVGLVAATVGLALAAAVAAGVAAVVVSCGFTNVFGGAFGGAVASAFILARVRSAAERSEIAVQPLSITTSETRSLTVRGRWNPGILLSNGTVITISSPRTVAAALSLSTSGWRRRR